MLDETHHKPSDITVDCRTHPLRMVILFGVWCSMLCGGCTLLKKQTAPEPRDETTDAAAAELRNRINLFVDYFEATVDAAAMEVDRKTSNKATRRKVATWRVQIITDCRSRANNRDLKASFADIWTLCQQQFDYFSTGGGKQAFSETYEIGLTAAKSILDAFETIARDYVPEDQWDEAKAKVTEYAQQNPIKTQSEAPTTTRISEDSQAADAFGDVLMLPFAPLTALSGLSKTSDSVHDVSRSVEYVGNVVDNLPANARWQMQLLLLNTEELPTVVKTVASISKLSDNSTQFVQTLDELPEEVRAQAELLLERIDKSHPEMRQTLVETQKTTEVIRSATADVATTAKVLNETVALARESSESLEKAANAVTETVREIKTFLPDNASEPTTGPSTTSPSTADGSTTTTPANPIQDPVIQEDRSFSFQAVTESANALTATSEQLQVLLSDLLAFMDDDAIDRRLNHTLDTTNARIVDVVNHVALRCGQLLLLFFAVMFIYRIIITRLLRTSQQ